MDLFVSFSSPFFRFLFCLCCFVAFISADPNFVSTYYERINVDDLTTNLKTLSTVIETTRFNCAITCNKVQDCTIVSFHRGKKVCRLLGEDKLGMSPEESFEKGNVVFFKKLGDFDPNTGRFMKADDVHQPQIYRSCKEVFQDHKTSGVYKITLPDDSMVDVYCIMENIIGCGGGGWALAMKINGSEPTFTYTSIHWSSNSTLNYPKNLANLDNQEMKSPIYWSTSFNEICIGMKYKGETKWLLIKQSHNSLQSVFSTNSFYQTSLNDSSWTKLMTGIQIDNTSVCTEQGLNVALGSYGYGLKLRIGLIGSGNTCYKPAWFIGIGASVTSSCGNALLGKAVLDSFGYVLIQ